MEKGRVVFLDTSVVIAALLSHTGGSARVIFEYSNKYHLVINDHVQDELTDLLPRKFAKQPELANELFVMLGLAQIEILTTPPLPQIRSLYHIINKKDAPILASAIHMCEYLLSLDDDFLQPPVTSYAKKYGLSICTPGEFLQQHQADSYSAA